MCFSFHTTLLPAPSSWQKEEAGRASADISDAEFLRVSEILKRLVCRLAEHIVAVSSLVRIAACPHFSGLTRISYVAFSSAVPGLRTAPWTSFGSATSSLKNRRPLLASPSLRYRNWPLVQFGTGLGLSSLPGQSCLSGEADVRAHAAVCPWQSSIQGTAAGGRKYLSTCESQSRRLRLCVAFTLAGQFVFRQLFE